MKLVNPYITLYRTYLCMQCNLCADGFGLSKQLCVDVKQSIALGHVTKKFSLLPVLLEKMDTTKAAPIKLAKVGIILFDSVIPSHM